MQPTIDERGINVFLSNYVKEPTGVSHGHFEYIPDLLNDFGLEDPLKFSIVAAGLAGHANKTHSSDLMGLARRQYAIALQKINIALRSPTEAVKDSTLYAYFRVCFPSTECLGSSGAFRVLSLLLKWLKSSGVSSFPNRLILTRAQAVHNSGRYI
jgi:hypothetical protein